MAALDFPAAPTVGQKYPQPPVPAQPVYTWDGEKWTTLGGTVGSTGASDLVPLPDTAAGESGSSTLWSRGDHAHPQDPLKVNKAGDTMTGTLNINTAQPRLDMYKGSGQPASITAFNATAGNLPRWSMSVGDGAAETGGNAGSDFRLDRFGDNGVFIDTPFSIARSSANVTLTGSIYAGGAVTAFGLIASQAGGITTGATQIVDGATQSTLFVNGGSNYVNYTKATGQTVWVVSNSVNMSIDSGGVFRTTTKGYQPGGGSWGDSNSDIRAKNVQGEYTSGLDEVAQLRPVIYTFKGNNTFEPPDHIASPDGTKSKEAVTVPYPNSPHRQVAETQQVFYGLIAQEAEIPFPEMVTKQSGYIDGQPVADLRGMDTTPLIFALVNAVKELKARVEQLEAAA